MLGRKPFVRRGVVFSAVGHGGLLLCLLVLGIHGQPSAPPPAMMVELVPPEEAPQTDTSRVEGTPLESHSSGSEVSSDIDKGSASTAPPRPKSKLPSLQQPQDAAKAQPSVAATEPQTAAPAEPETQPQATEPLLPPNAPKADPKPLPKAAAAKVNGGDMFAMPLALPGGQLGGGFDAPARNAAMLPHDDTAAFRARLTSCSHLPAGYDIDRNVTIVVRLSFKRDGTLAAPPKLVDASLSPDSAILMSTTISALQACAPFTELPQDKYSKWKTLDLVVSPLALSAAE